MNKMEEFYMRVLGEEILARELAGILGTVPISEATDEMLGKIGELAKKLGYEISAEEARGYLAPKEEELSDEDLDAVAGGKGETIEVIQYICAVGGQVGKDEDNFGENAQERSHIYKKTN